MTTGHRPKAGKGYTIKIVDGNTARAAQASRLPAAKM